MSRKHEVIRFENVSKCFRTPTRPEVWAVREFNLTCLEGELTCVLGPSGCGKTTLLRLAAGLETPATGRVCVNDATVTGPPGNIALVSQEGDLLPWRRVLGNVALGLEIRGMSRRERIEKAENAINRVRLPMEVALSFPHELSGGMRRRVALARAVCMSPRVLLMDEPFSSLDEPTRHRLQTELLELWIADRQTVLFVTHSLDEAVYLADRIVVMTSGRTVAEYRLDLDRPRDRLSGEFVEVLLKVRRVLADFESITAGTDVLQRRPV